MRHKDANIITVPGPTAGAAGLRPWDKVIEIDGVPCNEMTLAKTMSQLERKPTHTLTVLRKSKDVERPAPPVPTEIREQVGTTSVEEVYAYEYDVEYDLRMRLGGFGVLRDEHETASTQTHKKVVRLEDCLHQTLEAAASPVLEVSTDSKVFAAATTVAVALGTAATCGALTAVRTAVSLGATAGRAGAAVSAAAASRKATAVAAPDATPEAPAAADVEAVLGGETGSIAATRSGSGL